MLKTDYASSHLGLYSKAGASPCTSISIMAWAVQFCSFLVVLCHLQRPSLNLRQFLPVTHTMSTVKDKCFPPQLEAHGKTKTTLDDCISSIWYPSAKLSFPCHTPYSRAFSFQTPPNPPRSPVLLKAVGGTVLEMNWGLSEDDFCNTRKWRL